MKFSEVKGWKIPEGNITQVKKKGSYTLWGNFSYNYVSLGDSIAAGWGVDDRAEDSYFGLIRNKLKTIYRPSQVYAVNHAEGGDQVNHLMKKLDDATIKKDVAEADMVTVCIGANDVLTPVMLNLEEYITAGDSALVTIDNEVQANIAKLADDTNPNSYMALLNKLIAINPNANYVFMTVYNPYKYLWIEDGKDGFFKPLLDTIPKMSILWDTVDIGEYIKDYLLDQQVIRTLVSRVNGLDAWSEKFVTQINEVLRDKISRYKNTNPNANFFIAEAKALFDSIPDRTGAGEVHYNDLVHVEYTRGWDMGDIHWGALWEGSSATAYWTNKVQKYLVNDAFNFGGLATEFAEEAAEIVIAPNCDPHPDYDGYYLLMRSFADTLQECVPTLSSLPTLKTITYHANGGAGIMATQKAADESRNKKVYTITHQNGFSSTTEGYYFSGWKDGSGNSCSNKQAIHVGNNIDLYAQWSNMYTVAWRKVSNNEYVSPSGHTGPVTKDGNEYYLRATLGGAVLAGLSDEFDSSGVSQIHSTQVPYGTELYIQLINTGSYDRGAVYLNGNRKVGNSEYCYYTKNITDDTTIEFVWEYELSVPEAQSYWIAYLKEYPKAV